MSQSLIMQLAKDAFTVTLLTAAPLLLASVVVGVCVAILQAATQIQEMTLTFVPKVVAIGVVGAIFGPWMLDVLSVYTTQLLASLPTYAR
ncbi:MAG: flagellar biosynthesis protein FliQ [Chloroflexota bacterium]|jgi:flagellar biosynthetic protein FliQ